MIANLKEKYLSNIEQIGPLLCMIKSTGDYCAK